MKPKPLLLCICDGLGCTENNPGNAVAQAYTPNLDALMSNNPTTYLSASGLDVGLPTGQMGNSEVGHTNIGAGRVVYQDLTRINQSIENHTFYQNKQILNAMHLAKGHALHIMGLLSDGGVHSHIDHLFALLRTAKKNHLEKVYIHCFLDGRDVSPTSGAGFLTALQEEITRLGIGEIATVSGRYYAMDRDNRWARVQLAYDAIVKGVGSHPEANLSPAAYVQQQYTNGITDEFILPTVFSEDALVQQNDRVIYFNFRPDRARQLTRTMVDPSFDLFPVVQNLNVHFLCLTQYDELLPNVSVAFPPTDLTNTFGEVIAQNNLQQLRIAETEKYAHVTFFFNGGVEVAYPGESRVLVPSPHVATYDLKPEMSAFAVTEILLQKIEEELFDVIILNFANCDMVGHTGNMPAAITAVETVDTCVGKVVNAIAAKQGITIITADHGNAEKMMDENNLPFTAHTTNLVPFILCGTNYFLKENGKLCDIAPTMLELLELSKPPEMTGESLLLPKN